MVRRRSRWGEELIEEAEPQPQKLDRPTDPQFRKWLKMIGLGSVFAGGAFALSKGPGLVGRVIAPIRSQFSSPPTGGSAAAGYVSLVPQASRPAGIPQGGIWVGTDNEEKMYDGTNDIFLRQPVFNVKSYGAKGDGVTVDKAAIVAAMAAVPSTGGIVYFPDGTYLTDNVVGTISKPNTTFMFSANAIVKAKTGTSFQYFFLVQANGFTSQGGQFDATGATVNFGYYVVSVSSTDHIIDGATFTGIGASGADGGIHFLANSVTIRRVRVSRCTLVSGNRLVTVDASGTGVMTDFEIINNTIVSSTDAGIATFGVSSSTTARGSIVGNVINNTGGHGISVGAYTTDVTVAANVVQAAGAMGIVLGTACTRVAIVGNVCRNCVTHGISIDPSVGGGVHFDASYTVIGNICSGTTTFHGIYTALADYGIIEGNICRNNAQYGILVDGDHVLCRGNQCLNNGNNGIDLGTDVTVIAIVEGNEVQGIAGTPTANWIIRNNKGYNPQGAFNVTVGGSPFTYTNNDGVPEVVYVEALGAVTVTDVTKNSWSIFSNPGSAGYAVAYLQPGESIIVTYPGSAPSMRKDLK